MFNLKHPTFLHSFLWVTLFSPKDPFENYVPPKATGVAPAVVLVPAAQVPTKTPVEPTLFDSEIPDLGTTDTLDTRNTDSGPENYSPFNQDWKRVCKNKYQQESEYNKYHRCYQFVKNQALLFLKKGGDLGEFDYKNKAQDFIQNEKEK